MYNCDLSWPIIFGEAGRGFATHLLSLLTESSVWGSSDFRGCEKLHRDGYVHWTPRRIDDLESLALGARWGCHSFLLFLNDRTYFYRVWAGPPCCWIPPFIEFLYCDELWHFAASLFKNVNTRKMFLITEAAWISSVCWWGAHQEERRVFQSRHWHIWYWVDGVKLHSEKCMVFDCFMRILVLLL